ncbi:hypothetical protein K461DRAFT_289501 [Myriangium duriaei CBS 260.36]|uniref:Uncharacterized protein n=1 Tax=Myriangium duriaei CBS 260.36 TaxID=1168546 RepID=A0A9P4JDT3_9PEZI|nr:hypothetical protein K461DRAFT_289501 [Myriangium duriaei CBS 260.36]
MVYIPSPGDLWEIFKIVKEGIEKIKNAPAVVASVEKRMDDLKAQLDRLKEHFVDKKGQIVKSLNKPAADQLRRILTELYQDIDGVGKIIGVWNDKTGPFGTTFRFEIVAQAAFALGKNPERLEKLEKEIEYHRSELSTWITLTILETINQKKPDPKPLQNKSAPAGDVSIIFLDKENIGRSKIAEAYAKLVQDWTIKSKGHWRIKDSQSAGFNVSHCNECLEQLKTIGGRMWPGDAAPHPMALSALFDNALFKSDFKDKLWDTMAKSRSHGIRNTIFKDHDYIIVFTPAMKKALEALKETLVKQYGPSAAPPNKAKVIILGQYGNVKTNYIVQPSDTKDPQKDRRAWNQLVGTIKVAFKNFLKFELDWAQPR